MLIKFDSSIVMCIAAYESTGVIIIQSTQVVAKFIRYMAHRVTCNDLIGLLKSCSVSRALGTNLHLLEIRYEIVH